MFIILKEEFKNYLEIFDRNIVNTLINSIIDLEKENLTIPLNEIENSKMSEISRNNDLNKQFQKIQLISKNIPINFLVVNKRNGLLEENDPLIKNLLKGEIKIFSYKLYHEFDFFNEFTKYLEQIFEDFHQNLNVFPQNLLVLYLGNSTENQSNLHKIMTFIRNKSQRKGAIKPFIKKYGMIFNSEVSLKDSLKIVSSL